MLKHRRALRAERARWETIATAAGLEGSRLIRAEETRTRQRFWVDVRHCTKNASQLAGRNLAEAIAAVLALPAERVRITTDPKHAGNIIITVQTTDPWAADVTHPALDPARRSIMDGPIVVGEEPDTGRPLTLTVYDKDGAWHTLIMAATNGGKNHIPTPEDPAILILLDEGDKLLGADSPVAHKAREHVGDI